MFATLAQLVEQHFRKVEVPGSIPGGGSRIKACLVNTAISWYCLLSVLWGCDRDTIESGCVYDPVL